MFTDCLRARLMACRKSMGFIKDIWTRKALTQHHRKLWIEGDLVFARIHNGVNIFHFSTGMVRLLLGISAFQESARFMEKEESKVNMETA